MTAAAVGLPQGAQVLERFSDSAQRAIIVSQTHARVLRHDVIGSEHLLLAMADPDGYRPQPSAVLLQRCGASFHRVLSQVEELRARGNRSPDQLSFTNNAERLLKRALVVAMSMDSDRAETGHLIIAMVLSHDDGSAHRILRRLVSDVEDLREQAMASLALESPAVGTSVVVAPAVGSTTQVVAARTIHPRPSERPVASEVQPVVTRTRSTSAVPRVVVPSAIVTPRPAKPSPVVVSAPAPTRLSHSMEISATPDRLPVGVVVMHLTASVEAESSTLRSRAQKALPGIPIVGFDGAEVSADVNLWRFRRIPSSRLLVLLVVGPGGMDPEGRLRRNDPLLNAAVDRAVGLQVPIVPVLVGGAEAPQRRELSPSERRLAWIMPFDVDGDPATAELDDLFRTVEDLGGLSRGGG